MDTLIYLDDRKRRSRVGEGCLRAVVSNSGFFLKTTLLDDDYGEDFEIKELKVVNGNQRALNTYFKIQLKSSTTWSIRDSEIVFDLESKTYNDIVLHNQQSTTKLILVLMCLKFDSESWCSIDKDFIKIENSLFWFHTDSLEMTANEATIRIKVPLNQVFNEAAIKYLIETFKIKAID